MASNADNAASLVTALVAEFGSLKEEIRARSHDQSTAISLNITAIGAIGSLYLTEEADARILFLIPIIASLLGMRWVDHAINIDSLGRFVQKELKPALASALGTASIVDYEVFAESFAENSGLRFFLLGLPIFLLFAGLPGTALVLPFIVIPREQYDTPFWFGAIVAAAFLALFCLFWFHVIKRAKRALPA
jgi:hypothetical protein